MKFKSTETARKNTLKEGDKFTIEGWGLSTRGHIVRNGRSAKTGRRMKVKTPQVFVVTSVGAF